MKLTCIVFVLLVLLVVCVRGRLRVLSLDDMIGVPANLCSYYAADVDMSNAGLNNAVANFCQQQLGQRPASVHVNPDDNPYKMCLVAENATFGNLQPTNGQTIVAKDFFNNTSDQVVTHQFSLTGSFSESIAIATTNTVTLSVSVSYGVVIPTILSAKFAIDTTFYSSQTTSRSSTNTVSYTPSTTTACAPHCAYTAATTVQTSLYKADMTVPLCLSGYARCQYSTAVKGHYYWFVLVDDFVQPTDRCFHQAGNLGSLISDINSQTTFTKSCY